MAFKEPTNEDTRLYKLDRDIEQVLHSIVNDFNRNKDYKKRWNINPKEEVFVNIKFHGGFLELRVQGLRGGWRVGYVDNLERQKYLDELKEYLKTAESDLRKQFKEKTGKSFRWSKVKDWADYEHVGLNSLFRFHAVKSGFVTVDLGRQKFSEKGPELNAGKKVKDADKGLVDILKLPEKWR